MAANGEALSEAAATTMDLKLSAAGNATE